MCIAARSCRVDRTSRPSIAYDYPLHLPCEPYGAALQSIAAPNHTISGTRQASFHHRRCRTEARRAGNRGLHYCDGAGLLLRGSASTRRASGRCSSAPPQPAGHAMSSSVLVRHMRVRTTGRGLTDGTATCLRLPKLRPCTEGSTS